MYKSQKYILVSMDVTSLYTKLNTSLLVSRVMFESRVKFESRVRFESGLEFFF